MTPILPEFAVLPWILHAPGLGGLLLLVLPQHPAAQRIIPPVIAAAIAACGLLAFLTGPPTPLNRFCALLLVLGALTHWQNAYRSGPPALSGRLLAIHHLLIHTGVLVLHQPTLKTLPLLWFLSSVLVLLIALHTRKTSETPVVFLQNSLADITLLAALGTTGLPTTILLATAWTAKVGLLTLRLGGPHHLPTTCPPLTTLAIIAPTLAIFAGIGPQIPLEHNVRAAIIAATVPAIVLGHRHTTNIRTLCNLCGFSLLAASAILHPTHAPYAITTALPLACTLNVASEHLIRALAWEHNLRAFQGLKYPLPTTRRIWIALVGATVAFTAILPLQYAAKPSLDFLIISTLFVAVALPPIILLIRLLQPAFAGIHLHAESALEARIRETKLPAALVIPAAAICTLPPLALMLVHAPTATPTLHPLTLLALASALIPLPLLSIPPRPLPPPAPPLATNQDGTFAATPDAALPEPSAAHARVRITLFLAIAILALTLAL